MSTVATRRSVRIANSIVRHSDENGCRLTAEKYGMSIYAVKALRQRVARRALKMRALLKEEDLLAVRIKAINWWRKRYHDNRHQDAEDFASFYTLETIKNGYYLQFITVAISFLKYTYGDTTNETGALKCAGIMTAKTIIEDFDKDDPETGGVQVGEMDTTEKKLAVIRAAEEFNLTGHHKSVIILQHHFGMKISEIAVILSVNPHTIEKVIAENREIIRSKMDNEL